MHTVTQLGYSAVCKIQMVRTFCITEQKYYYPSRIYGSERVWNVLLGAWQTFSDPMYLEKNIKFHQIFVIGEKNIKIFEHSSPHPFLQAPLHICVICPNPSLGCLPPKSDRRQCSRLCSVLLCIIFLQHMCYVPTPV